MKKHSIFFAVAVTSAMFALGETAEPTTGYVPLANTVRKLKSDKALKVAVIGDSIAYGQMVQGLSMQGYPYTTRVTTNSGGMPTGNPMSFARITTDYVKHLAKRDYGVDDVDIDTFYSVWGGATAKSSFGYVSDDIIARQPDLVFYEIWNDNDETLRYAENTLRVLWKTLPNTDVVLISVGGAFARSAVYQAARREVWSQVDRRLRRCTELVRTVRHLPQQHLRRRGCGRQGQRYARLSLRQRTPSRN